MPFTLRHTPTARCWWSHFLYLIHSHLRRSLIAAARESLIRETTVLIAAQGSARRGRRTRGDDPVLTAWLSKRDGRDINTASTHFLSRALDAPPCATPRQVFACEWIYRILNVRASFLLISSRFSRIVVGARVVLCPTFLLENQYINDSTLQLVHDRRPCEKSSFGIFSFGERNRKIDNPSVALYRHDLGWFEIGGRTRSLCSVDKIASADSVVILSWGGPRDSCFRDVKNMLLWGKVADFYS